jgi:hypothetical protein
MMEVTDDGFVAVTDWQAFWQQVLDDMEEDEHGS